MYTRGKKYGEGENAKGLCGSELKSVLARSGDRGTWAWGEVPE